MKVKELIRQLNEKLSPEDEVFYYDGEYDDYCDFVVVKKGTGRPYRMRYNAIHRGDTIHG